MVSVRIDQRGKKISDRFEKIRAVQQLNTILGIDVKHNAGTDIASAVTYQFATKAQFMMILESRGYVLREADTMLQVIKFGKLQDAIGLNAITDKLQSYQPDEGRKVQLKAIFHKYATTQSTALIKDRNGYSSEFSALLKEKFGIDLLFHASADKPPYGYTVIDHSGKQVFKGGEIIPLKELLAIQKISEVKMLPVDFGVAAQSVSKDQTHYYTALLKAALHNYPDLIQGLHHQGLMIFRNGESFNLHDPGAGITIGLADLLDENDYLLVVEHFSQSQEISEEVYRQQHHFRGFNLASDVDDEATLGMKRRRKKKARTNLR
jgi:hypothetical protein